MNKSAKNYWKIAIGGIMAFGSAENIFGVSDFRAGGETSVYINTSVIFFLVGLYLIYAGFYPSNKT